MNKKLIAVAIAAAVAAPAAMASDTTLYGKVHMSVNHSDSGSNSDQWNVSSHASRLGVKGSEDLGNGMKAIFKYEMTYDGTDSSTAIGSARNSYIGLAGDFGTVVVGRHDTPAKVALNSVGNEHLADSIVDFNATMNFHEVRTNNAIAYISPSFSGLTVAAAIVPGEGAPTSSTVTASISPFGMSLGTTGTSSATVGAHDGLADSYSLGLMYSGAGLKVGLGYENLANAFEGATGTDDLDVWQLSASYTMGDFSIGAQYESMDNWGYLDGVDKEAWGIVGRANFGNSYVFAQYGEAEVDFGAGLEAEDETFGIGLGHNLSKRTTVYAAYSNSDATTNVTTGANVDADSYGIGMIHNF
jgi:predicted porin